MALFYIRHSKGTHHTVSNQGKLVSGKRNRKVSRDGSITTRRSHQRRQGSGRRRWHVPMDRNSVAQINRNEREFSSTGEVNKHERGASCSVCLCLSWRDCSFCSVAREMALFAGRKRPSTSSAMLSAALSRPATKGCGRASSLIANTVGAACGAPGVARLPATSHLGKPMS